MKGLQTWQWVVLAVAAAAFLWPRKDALIAWVKSLAGGGTATTADDANTIAAAYKKLQPYLKAETAAEVRVQIADALLDLALVSKPQTTQVAPAASVVNDSLDIKLATLTGKLDEVLAIAKREEARP